MFVNCLLSMPTFKTAIKLHNKRKDGTYNIFIRVTHNRVSTPIKTPFYVSKDDVTRSGKIKNQYYIDKCDEQIKMYRQKCDSLGFGIVDMSLDQIIKFLKEDDSSFNLDFISYGRSYADKLKKKQKGTAGNYITAINNLVRFIGNDKLNIIDINKKFIRDWIDWILENCGERAATLYPSCIRAIFNIAKVEYNDEDAGIVRIPLSPFKGVILKEASTVSSKRALDVDDFRRVAMSEYHDVTKSSQFRRRNLSKDVFIMSFFLIGMNSADLYDARKKEYKNGRLTYQREKTKTRRDDKAEISIKVVPELLPYFEKYLDRTDSSYLFIFHRQYSTPNTFNQALNKGLKTILPNLEFYAARHTWASIARNECGIDKFTVHKALNHVTDEMKITDIYIKKDWRDIDEANRKVIDFVKLEIGSLEEQIKKATI